MLVNEIDFKSLGKKKILVAEDVELNQYLIKQILESWGLEVVIACNGADALQVFQQEYFDCVLMDVQMPEMDGIQATQFIRELPDPVKAAVPIIAFTANTLQGDKEEYIKAGMDDYLAKPFNEKNLFLVISRNLVSNKSLDSARSAVKTIINMEENHYPEIKLYDLSLVESVSGGDAGFIKKMIVLFIKTVPQNVQELTKGLEMENWEQVRKMAHKLKSTVDSMGIKSIHDEIRLVESNAKQKVSLQEIPAMIQHIEVVINKCIKQLQAEIG
jgi:CheY-like chemotaxis protein